MNFFEKHRKALAALMCLAGSTPLAAAAFALDTPIQAPASDTPPEPGDDSSESKTAAAYGQQNATAKSQETPAAAVPDANMPDYSLKPASERKAAPDRKPIADYVEDPEASPEEYAAESNHYDSENIVYAEPVTSEPDYNEVYEEPEMYMEETDPVYEQQNATEPEYYEPVYTDPVYEEPAVTETPVYEEPEVYAEETAPVYEQQIATEVVSYEEPVVYASQMNATESAEPAVLEESAPVMAEAEPVIAEPAAEETVQPEIQEEPAPAEEAAAAPEITEPVEPEAAPEVLTEEAAPAPEQETPAVAPADYSALNEAIRQSALSLVGTTDGDQCTEVVCKALEGAGISDPMNLWPDEYQAAYGSYTDTPQAGNIIYYDNGGRGVDHVAIYIGDGQAVHGNYITEDGSHTVIAPAELSTASTPQYIQVER